jgi:dTDP-4-dehydrorhamnose 3,5-epimerase
MGQLLKLLSTPIPDLIVAETSPVIDERGAFLRLYCEKELAPVIDSRRILQVNHSKTSKVGAVRGMHFQHPPHSEMKFVRCIKGKVWDVAVDLRAGSPTFLNWHAVQLTSSNSYMMAIPEGFAHGFQCLEAESELIYLHTALYNHEAEGVINYGDPRLNITWPLPVGDLSPRDSQCGFMDRGYKGITL